MIDEYGNSMDDLAHLTRKQCICDDCGKGPYRRLLFRSDFGEAKRLCFPCAREHDNSPEVIRERDHNECLMDMDDY